MNRTQKQFSVSARASKANSDQSTVPEMRQQIGWADATTELPADARAVARLESVFDDQPRLAAIRRPNHADALARHDWRDHIATMWQSLELPLDTRLGQGACTAATAAGEAQAALHGATAAMAR
jgi:hypothetical protein